MKFTFKVQNTKNGCEIAQALRKAACEIDHQELSNGLQTKRKNYQWTFQETDEAIIPDLWLLVGAVLMIIVCLLIILIHIPSLRLLTIFTQG